MQRSEELAIGLKDAVAVKYVSHFRGELKNSIFLDAMPPR